MKVDWKQQGKVLTFYFEPDKGDPTGDELITQGKKIRLARNECKFIMPEGWSKKTVHPDMLALATILMIEPFVSSEIELPLSVSKHFSDLYLATKGIKLSPVDATLSPRATPNESVAGLCFSGGVDSTAAAIIMPKSSLLVFVDRIMPSEKAGLYKKEAALYSCEKMNQLGHRVLRIETDYELLREPTGFATSYSSAVPLILLADHYKLNSVGYGMVLESAFAIGDVRYKEPSSSQFKLMTESGLPLNLVVSGLSEVSTSRIVTDHPEYADHAQSCMRGDVGAPCMKCMKCLRKQLLGRALQGKSFRPIDLKEKLQLKEVYLTLTKSPLHHEGVYTYIYAKGSANSLAHWLLKRKVRAHSITNDWLGRWYGHSSVYFPEPVRQQQTEKIRKLLDEMDDNDVKELKAWDPEAFSSKKLYNFWSELFSRYASHHYERSLKRRQKSAVVKGKK